jgi:group I intron endonuclease
MIGIYKITSPSGRIYIGQSINIQERWYFHKLRNCKKLTKLNRSFNKYGINNHIFEVIEECEECELNNRERHYQDLYDVLNKGLNCILTNSTDRSGKLSEETKLKLSNSRKGKYLKENNPFYGRKHSIKTIEKIRNSQIGNKSWKFGKKESDETKLKKSISQSRGKGSGAKRVIDMLTLKEWDCLKDAAEDLKINYSTLKTWMRGPLSKNKTNLKYMNKKEENTRNILIFVYGTLRKNNGNHRLIENADFLGEHATEPIYNMYSLGGFPALKLNGNTSIKGEVYAVNASEAMRVDSLEGYSPNETPTFYDKTTIETPWGQAGVYIYVGQPDESRLIESGDWKEYRNNLQQKVVPTY